MMHANTHSLLDLEKVLALSNTVLWQIRAVEPVTYSVDAELGPQCVSTQILGYFWVHWSTNLSESRYSVLLAHF